MLRKLNILLLTLGLTGCAVQKKQSMTWPAYQGGMGHHGFAEEGPTPPLELLWKFKTEGRILYSPVGSKTALYLGSRDGYLYALNPDGTSLWKRKLEGRNGSGGGGPYKGLFLQNNDIYSSQYGLYYFVFAWDEQGKQKWKYQTGELEGLPPQISGNGTNICFNEDPEVGSKTPQKSRFSCARSDGQILWSAPLKGRIKNLPAFNKKLAYIAQSDPHKLIALDNVTGNKVWEGVMESAPASTPLVDIQRQRIYIVSQKGFLYAYHFNGKLDWRYQFPKVGFSKDMALSGDLLLIPSIDNKLYTFDVSTREQKWVFRASAPLTAPISTQKFVYIGSENRNFYILDREKGYVRWSYSTRGAILAPPILYQNMVLVGSSDGHLYAFKTIESKVKKGPKPTLLDALF